MKKLKLTQTILKKTHFPKNKQKTKLERVCVSVCKKIIIN